jgi:hypothetical protein
MIPINFANPSTTKKQTNESIIPEPIAVETQYVHRPNNPLVVIKMLTGPHTGIENSIPASRPIIENVRRLSIVLNFYVLKMFTSGIAYPMITHQISCLIKK